MMRRVFVAAGATSALLLAGLLPQSAAGAAPEGCHPGPWSPVCRAGAPAATATFVDPTARVENAKHISLGERVFVGPFAELVATADAPISIGEESNAQDNVLILGKP